LHILDLRSANHPIPVLSTPSYQDYRSSLYPMKNDTRYIHEEIRNPNTKCCLEDCYNEATTYDAENFGFCILHNQIDPDR
jgi:hypothetical protein